MCVLPKANIGRLGCAAALAALLFVNVSDRALSDTGCLNAATSPDQAEIAAFLANPSELLEHYPAAGPALSARVQRLAASDPSTVHALVALAKNAKPVHVVSLSMGLSRAATQCAAKRPDITQAIKQVVASEGSPSLRALFTTESTISELAAGSPDHPAAALPPPAGLAQPSAGQPGAPSKGNFDALIKNRPPGFLLPTDFGLPPAPGSDTRLPASDSNRGSTQTSPTGATTAASSPSAAPGNVTPPSLPSLDGGSAPFTLLEAEAAAPPPGSGIVSRNSLTAPGPQNGDQSPRPPGGDFLWSSEGGPSGYNHIVSPAH